MKESTEDKLLKIVAALFLFGVICIMSPVMLFIPSTLMSIAFLIVRDPVMKATGWTWPNEFGFFTAGACAYLLLSFFGVFTLSKKKLMGKED